MSNSNTPIQELLHEIRQKSDTLKSRVGIPNDDLLEAIHLEYETVLTQKELELQQLKERVHHLQIDYDRLSKIKDDLLLSLKSETNNHRQSLEALSLEEAEHLRLLEENTQLGRVIAQMKAAHAQALIALENERSELKERLEKLEEDRIAVDALKEKAAKLQNYIDRGGIAYNKMMGELQNEQVISSLRNILKTQKES